MSKKPQPAPDPVEKLTRWVGSRESLVLHTIVFIGFFIGSFFNFLSWDLMFLILTTIVSLEAIYLAIFIQMTVNRQAASLREVEEDIDEIQEDVEEMQEDVDEIQEDIDEIQEDVDEIQEDVEDMTEEEKVEAAGVAHDVSVEKLMGDVRRILADLETLKKKG